MGQNSRALTALAAWDEHPPLEGLFRANLALSAFNLLAFAALAYELLGGWLPTLGAAVAIVLTPLFWVAATSELHGPLFFSYLLVGLLLTAESAPTDDPSARDSMHCRAWRRARRRTWRRTWRRQVIALAALALCAFLAAQTRLETAVVSLPVLVLAAARLRLGRARFASRATALTRGALTRLRALTLRRPLRVAAATLALAFGLDVACNVLPLLEPHRIRAPLRALSIFDSSTLSFPTILWPTISPGLVLLILVGLLGTLRRPLRSLWFGMGTLALFRAYWASAHDGTAPYEMTRYATLLSPLVAVLAVLGWREIQRRWPGGGVNQRARALLMIVLVAGTLGTFPHFESLRLSRNFTHNAWADTDVMRAATGRYAGEGQRPASPDASPARILPTQAGWLSTESQRQVRFIAGAIRWRPDCRILMPIVGRSRAGRSSAYRPKPAGFMVFEGVGDHKIVRQDSLAALRRSAPQLLRGCVWLHLGLDCHEVASDRCLPDMPPDLRLLARSDFASEGYAEPDEHGLYLSAIGLRLYDLTARVALP